MATDDLDHDLLAAAENGDADGVRTLLARGAHLESKDHNGRTPLLQIDALNYAPRVRMPTLMLNGRYDFETPFDTSQRPLFALLGSPAEHKQHTVFETGHALPIEGVAREILPWLDHYLGPVVQGSPVPTRIPAPESGR